MSDEEATPDEGDAPLLTETEAEAYIQGPAAEIITWRTRQAPAPVEDAALAMERLRAEISAVPSNQPLLRQKLEAEWEQLVWSQAKQEQLARYDEMEEQLASVEPSPIAKATYEAQKKMNAARVEKGLRPIPLVGEGGWGDFEKEELTLARAKVQAIRDSEYPGNVIEEIEPW